jgi:uncharacterized membrane protein YvbJ
MVICPDCGTEVPDAKFCKNCGASLPQTNEDVNVEERVPVVIENNEEDASQKGSQNAPKFCHNCGFELNGEFKFCPNCGYDIENKTGGNVNSKSYNVVTSSHEKSIIVSIILSVILPGVGHFYLGLSRKGAIFLIAYFVSAILILLLVGLLLTTVIWIWALVDVIQSTNALNRGEGVEDKLL